MHSKNFVNKVTVLTYTWYFLSNYSQTWIWFFIKSTLSEFVNYVIGCRRTSERERYNNNPRFQSSRMSNLNGYFENEIIRQTICRCLATLDLSKRNCFKQNFLTLSGRWLKMSKLIKSRKKMSALYKCM